MQSVGGLHHARDSDGGRTCVLPRLFSFPLLSILLVACGGLAAGSPVAPTVHAGPKCADTPTLLVDGSALLPPGVGVSATMDLAVSSTDIYVAINSEPNGTLVRVPVRGGKPVVTANFVGTEESLLVTGESVVFAQSLPNSTVGSSGQIVRTDLKGGGATVLASGSGAQGSVFGLATDGQNVYFAEQDGVRSVPLAGGPVRTLTAHTGALAVVGSNLVIADSLAQGVFAGAVRGRVDPGGR